MIPWSLVLCGVSILALIALFMGCVMYELIEDEKRNVQWRKLYPESAHKFR